METVIPESSQSATREGKGGAASAGKTRSLERNNLILVILGSLISVYWQDRAITLSFLAGGLISILNLRMLTSIVGNLTRPEGIPKGKLVLQVLVKYLGLLGSLAFLFLVLHPQPVAVLVGLSTVVAAVLLEGLLGIFRN